MSNGFQVVQIWERAMFIAQYRLDNEWVPFSLTATSIHEAFGVARDLVGQGVGLCVNRNEEDTSDLEWVTQRTPSWVR